MDTNGRFWRKAVIRETCDFGYCAESYRANAPDYIILVKPSTPTAKALRLSVRRVRSLRRRILIFTLRVA